MMFALLGRLLRQPKIEIHIHSAPAADITGRNFVLNARVPPKGDAQGNRRIDVVLDETFGQPRRVARRG